MISKWLYQIIYQLDFKSNTVCLWTFAAVTFAIFDFKGEFEKGSKSKIKGIRFIVMAIQWVGLQICTLKHWEQDSKLDWINFWRNIWQLWPFWFDGGTLEFKNVSYKNREFPSKIRRVGKYTSSGQKLYMQWILKWWQLSEPSEVWPTSKVDGSYNLNGMEEEKWIILCNTCTTILPNFQQKL